MTTGGPTDPVRLRELLRTRWDVLLVVAAGGAAGALARWLLEQRWPARPGQVPWATLGINLTGCALLGALVVVLTLTRPTSRYLRPALGSGVLGGFTTFSTAMAESRALVVGGALPVAAGYLLASVVGGLLVAALAGAVTGRLLTGRLLPGAGGPR